VLVNHVDHVEISSEGPILEECLREAQLMDFMVQEYFHLQIDEQFGVVTVFAKCLGTGLKISAIINSEVIFHPKIECFSLTTIF
jgi:protein-arginine kinase